MDESELRKLIGQVGSGTLSRRQFVRTLVGLGLTAPIAGHLLMHAGVAQAQSQSVLSQYKPTRRGGGGALRLLWWQAATLLNPHFATGTKDQDAARIFYEPLAEWDADANLVPILAAEIPSVANGGVAKDGMSVTWKLKRNVQWHDGQPFTADDLVFNWEYAADPATSATTIGSYQDIRTEKIDAYTVRLVFKKPTPFWGDPFVGGARGMIIPKHLFDAYRGAKSRDAPANLKPVGTGAYKFADFKPGDTVKGELNANYHMPNRPFFDTVEMKGGGDAVSAARAVLQTGEFDFAWNLQVEDEILLRLEAGGKGRAFISQTGNMEHIQVNFTDPWKEVDGERSSLKTTHPLLSDPAVREALNMLLDRNAVQEHIYGRAGTATRNWLYNPERFRSPNNKWEFNIDKANQVLETAGWKRGADGIRAKDGKPLKMVFQTSINAPRQKTQAIFKQACQKAGIELELKTVTASVFFSSDINNPDTFTKFYCDLQMLQFTMTQPDPGTFMDRYVTWEVSSKANKWQGRNLTRWRNDEYDKVFRAAESELDPVKRAALMIRMNDLIIDNRVVIPVINASRVSGVHNKLKAPMSGWSNSTWLIQDWYRET
jgi:peptide/nickel transport system substrate-binding protein